MAARTKRRARPTPQSRTRTRPYWLVPVAVLLAAAVGIAVAVWSQRAGPDAAADDPTTGARSARASSTTHDPARRQAGDPFATGSPDAPVVLVEYTDFQCPFCGKFARDTEPTLIKRYVSQGVLRIEWRAFPIFGDASVAAAQAGVAAGRQGRFRQFHAAAYAHPHKPGDGYFSTGRLRHLARQSGVTDLDRFERDSNSSTTRKAIQADMTEGQRIGIPSTPAFLVNGQPILGAQPLSSFRHQIDKARQAAGDNS